MTRRNAPALLGMGTALPPVAITQHDAASLALELTAAVNGNARAVTALYRRSGVRRRHSVLLENAEGHHPEQSFYRTALNPGDRGPGTRRRMETYADRCPPLAAEAPARALSDAEADPASITHLVTVSCSGFHAPGIDSLLIDRLGLRPEVERTHVGFMGCHGAINGLRVSRAFCGTDPRARVLLCAVELCSLHFQFSDLPDLIVANSLFADGAGAAVLGMDGGESWRIVATGSCLFPDSLDAMSWTIGDHGFTMTLSARVPDLIAAHLRPWFERWLGAQGLGRNEIRSWAVHPGGPRILDAVEQALELPPEALAESRAVLRDCGNMSSPTIMFIIERLRRSQQPTPCVALAFGPGLVAEAALLR